MMEFDTAVAKTANIKTLIVAVSRSSLLWCFAVVMIVL